ncbi:hypothetical protein A7P25_02040 [Achromobacter xylosoxidans]|nr:hypothetical protein A7P25_02040 [Achromobacter xylosoxidans]
MRRQVGSHIAAALNVQRLYSRHDRNAAYTAEYALLPFAEQFQTHLHMSAFHNQIALSEHAHSPSGKSAVLYSVGASCLETQIKDMVR